jgi:hypothetical protein
MSYGILILVLGMAFPDPGPVEALVLARAHATHRVEVGQGQARGQQEARQRQGQGRGQQEARQGQGQGRGQQEARQGQGQGRGQQEARQGQGQSRGQQEARQGQGQGRGQQQRQEARQGQGQGHGPQQRQEAQTGRGQPGPADRAPGPRGRGAPAASEGAGGPPGQAAGQNRGRITAADAARQLRRLSEPFQRLGASGRPHDRMVAGAAARGSFRGLDPARLEVRQQGEFVRVENRGGDVLLQLTQRDAQRMGHWTLRRLGDRRPRGNAPSFCRSGSGHPVWGREWCLDKGFGLGSRPGTIWSRAPIDDVVFRRGPSRERLARPVLIDVLGDIIFGRLALHALSLGYAEPLHGSWIAGPDAPRILHVHAGDHVIAELVDLDRDDRVDVIYIVQPLH